MEKGLTTDDKLKVLLSIAEECVSEEELRTLIASGKPMVFYDGFEPSGRMHIAQGLLRSLNVNKILSVDGKFTFYVADFFACLNGKLGGDLEKIQTAGRLMIETWKACGMNTDKVNFVWASEEIAKRPGDYFKLLIDVATKFTICRMKRCAPALGRDDTEEFIKDEEGNVTGVASDSASLSTLLYSAMQVADIPFLGVNVASLGVDQRKILVINREWALKNKRKPPILLMHHMLMGLDGSTKMAKSNPDAAIFMDDPPSVVATKIKKAFCPPRIVEGNPIIDYIKHLIFPMDGSFKVDERTFLTFLEFETAFKEDTLGLKELKASVAQCINRYLDPVQRHFAENEEARKLLERVKSFKITK